MCDVCHAPVHQGLLDVTGTVAGGLTWRRRPRPAGAHVRDADAVRTKLDALFAPDATRPRLGGADGRSGVPGRAQSAGADFGARPSSAGFHSRPNLGVSNTQVQELAMALKKMGYTRAEGERQVRWAIAQLMAERGAHGRGPGTLEPLDEADILMKALRG